MHKLPFLLSLFFILCSLHASVTRTMYVDGFENILGDVPAENALLTYAQSNGFETLLLYGLHVVHANHNLPNPATNQVLADFISKAKTSYGILSMGATAENGDFFTNVIDAYNNSRSDPLEKFDVYNLEFEYWRNAAVETGGYYCTTYLVPNGIPCTVDGAFQFYFSILQTMNSLANNNAHVITTEAYVGWPSAGQADTIGANLDKLRLHAYVSDPNTSFGYSENRLIDFANGNPGLEVSIIFSSEPTFMQTWLENNSMLAAENIYTNDWTNASSGWVNNINLAGFTYFAYSDLTNISLPVELTYFKGQSKDDLIQLDWEVSAEINLAFFEIERKDPNSNKFYSLGIIESKAHNSSAISYQFMDSRPNSGLNYYRLKQVDHDGFFHYSNTIAIVFSEEQKSTKIYPSLVQDYLHVASKEVIDQMQIYDANGREIKTLNDFDPILTKVDVANLNAGIYWVILTSDLGIETFKFIK